jgi:gliding motility-associated protein GldM
LRVNKFNAYVVPSSKTVIQGTKFHADIILAAVDSTKTPEYYVNGNKLSSSVYEVIANSTGTFDLKGKIGYEDQQGVMQFLPFQTQYEVVAPTATISNMDLNVMYSEYENPFSISVPGFNPSQLQVSCAHATVKNNGNGNWIIIPRNEAPKSLNIEVFASENGTKRLMGSQTYRVRPKPLPGVYFERDGVQEKPTKISNSALKNPKNKFVLSYGEDGFIKMEYEIVSFSVRLPNNTSVAVRGDRFSKEALNKIAGLKENAPLLIYEIIARDKSGNKRELDSFIITL